MRMPSFRKTWVIAALLAVLAQREVRSQAPDAAKKDDSSTLAQRLEKILADLRSVDPAAWEARIQDLERRIADHRAKAAALREEAKKLEASAASEEGHAKALAAEIEKQKALRQLLGQGPALPAT